MDELAEIGMLHPELGQKVYANMPEDTDIENLASLFKVFGDATRIRIVCALLTCELCVNDLAALLDMNQSAISHQLQVLRQAKLVRTRKDGKVVYYSLDDEHVTALVSIGMHHVKEL